ncbi:hypothetical protein TARUN_8920 [Trichoderma arundinaceum]|uniref:Uncharacterized protein n=1 Tax=Trichoderma arundinaceum TaxID=490622 RepID=A0A395NB55_TRIAR|nr:hypothetical protein TARUN_8920 [Trichoderma arundinaceum]
MSSSSASHLTTSLNRAALEQLSHLCILLAAANKSCMKRDGIKYASGDSGKGAPLTEFQQYLSKLALICDTEKGKFTMTALACLEGAKGPEYVFASNYRKPMELEDTKKFLERLLDYIVTNPEKHKPKTHKKQVLWRILEFNFGKLDYYLGTLVTVLDCCINECEVRRRPADHQILNRLYELRNKVNFSRDMTTNDFQMQVDCETLIKAIHASNNDSLEMVIESRIKEEHAGASENWYELRHYLGRLHSYRQASEVLVAASIKWPELFKNARISYISSARPKHIPVPKSSSINDIVSVALPEYDVPNLDADIAELEAFNLGEEIRQQLQKRRMTTLIHGEVQLHNYLVQRRKINSSDFWSGSMFIATSKPSCRLCHYYFDSPTNDFKIQASHMNIYPKWRLPDIYENQNEEAKERFEKVVEHIIEKMQHDLLQAFQNKVWDGKRHDSRTDSHRRMWTRATNLSRDTAEKEVQRERYSPGPATPPPDDDESYERISRDNYNTGDTESDGIGVGFAK